MIEKLDKFLIDRVFQPVVDLSQRKPAWWVRNVGSLHFLLIALCSATVIGWTWITVVSIFGVLLYYTLITSSDFVLAFIGSTSLLFRKVAMVLLALQCVVIFNMVPLTAEYLLTFASTALLLVAEYFAACRPPKPPVRRTSAKLSASGAA